MARVPRAYPSDLSLGVYFFEDAGTESFPIDLPAGVPTKITNDGLGGGGTSLIFAHPAVPVIYNPLTSELDFSLLNVGDLVGIRLHLMLTTTLPNTELTMHLTLGITPDDFRMPLVTDFDYKLAGAHDISLYNEIFIRNEIVRDNIATIELTAEKNSSVVVKDFLIKLLG
jgi:hypothetical protein